MVSDMVCSLEVRSNYFKQLRSGFSIKCARMLFRVDQMGVAVILNHFRHQVHDHFTANLLIERTLDGFDLTSDPADPYKEFLLFTDSTRDM